MVFEVGRRSGTEVVFFSGYSLASRLVFFSLAFSPCRAQTVFKIFFFLFSLLASAEVLLFALF